MGEQEIAYTAQTKDLSRLASDRVSEAINSVLQITEDTGEAYLVALSAVFTAVGAWAGAYAAHHMEPLDQDVPSTLEALANVMRAKLAEPSNG